MRDTVFEKKLATNAVAPSGVNATPSAPVPTVIGGRAGRVARSIGVTLPAKMFVTYAVRAAATPGARPRTSRAARPARAARRRRWDMTDGRFTADLQTPLGGLTRRGPQTCRWSSHRQPAGEMHQT